MIVCFNSGTLVHIIESSIDTVDVMNLILYCSELGDGWAPTVLETEEEHDFIKQSQKGLSDAGNYFIGGSAFPQHTGSFDYFSEDFILYCSNK